MRARSVFLCVASFILLPIFNGWARGQSPDLAAEAEYDTASIVIEYTSERAGRVALVKILMRNPEWVSGYAFRLNMSGPGDVARFRHYAGECDIPESPFPWVSCQCLNENCTSVFTEGNAQGDTTKMIEPNDDYVTLFRICAQTCCIPDADTLRYTHINIPWEESQLYGRDGDPIPFSVSSGELFVELGVPGDANGDQEVDAADVIALIGYLFLGTGPPCVCEAHDCDGNGATDIGDVMYVLNYIFLGGPAPVPGNVSCWYEDCWP